MRTAVATALLFTLPLFAQRMREPRGAPGNPNPIGAADLQRANDELNAKRAAEQARTLLRSPALKAAVHDFRANDLRAEPLHVELGEFVTPLGRSFVAMHFEVPAGVDMPEKATLFGEIIEADNTVFWSIEEEVGLTRTASGVSYYERSFLFPPGNRTATFGLAVEEKKFVMASLPMFLQGVDKDARRMSSLIMANEVFPMKHPQNADDPFAFGGLKVVPQASRVFRKSDPLWLFFEAQNPAVEGDTPKLITSVVLQNAQGKRTRSSGDVEVVPLKGASGRFGVGTMVDLSKLASGAYDVRVVVSDAIAGAKYELLGKISVID